MSQSSPAYPTTTATVPAPGADDTHPASPARPRLLASPRMALENWRVSWRLIALIVVPTAMGLTFAGLQVTTAVQNAQTLGRVERLAVLGQQITGLAQAMEGSPTAATPGRAPAGPGSGLAAAGRVPAQGGSASLATPVPAPTMARDSPAVPAPSETGPNVIIPPAEGPHLAGTLPIYDAVESDWFRARARGHGMTGPGGPWAGRPGSELRSWRSPGDEGWRAAAAILTPSVGAMTSAGLPRRVPQANLVPGSASDDQTRTATMAQSAQIARDRLANFQRGSRRARAASRVAETAEQLTPDD